MAGARRSATVSMPSFGSTATTDPRPPTRFSAARPTTPVLEQAVAVARGHHVEHRLGELPEERRHEELFVYLRGGRRDLPRGGIG